MTGCLVSPGQDRGHVCLRSLLLLPTQGPTPQSHSTMCPRLGWVGARPLSLSLMEKVTSVLGGTLVMTEIPPLPPTQTDPPPVARLREGALLSHTSTPPHSPERAGAGSVPP